MKNGNELLVSLLAQQLHQVKEPAYQKYRTYEQEIAKGTGFELLIQVHIHQYHQHQCQEYIEHSGKALGPANDVELQRSVSDPIPIFSSLYFFKHRHKAHTDSIDHDEYGY